MVSYIVLDYICMIEILINSHFSKLALIFKFFMSLD